VVAVIDTGVRANHPDLAGRVRTGRYFLHSDDGKVTFSGPGATTDSYGHGTHVAGIIGAIANNGQGITGAAPGVEILPVQVLCGDDGSGFSSDVAKGITWAANNGATVINLSLGGSTPSSAELQAIQYARNVKNVVVVASAGNSALKGNGANYPAAFPEVIGVGATTSANVRACYSTTGSFVALAAPGGGSSGCPSPSVLSTWKNGGYAGLSGTSMASPHVAAAAALVRAAHGLTTHLAVCNQLIRTADDLGPPNFDNQYGYGLVDPLEAVGTVVPSGVVCT
jgi:subtilisin family serine protease